MTVTPESLLAELMESQSLKQVAKTLNVSTGTIDRWMKLKKVPPHYVFDMLRALSKPVQYSNFSSKEKDQFFTPEQIVRHCWKVFQDVLRVDVNDYTFIEPSAGDGSFLKVLPPNTIALDVEPRSSNVVQQDYLTWQPPTSNKGYIVFGNPPFGLRGHLALRFINHSKTFADYVCFILPQLFESDGKGSPRSRVEGYNLIYSERMSTMFYTPEKTNVDVNVVFQIWSKLDTNPKYSTSKRDKNMCTIYSLSDGGSPSSTRNKEMIGNCDVYLPSTCFGRENMKAYDTFHDLPNARGYGIVFHKDKEELIHKAKNIDWGSCSFLSTNSAFNLRTSIIYNEIASA